MFGTLNFRGSICRGMTGSICAEYPTRVYVYPNPSKDVFEFIYKLPKDELADLNIFDCYGKIIYHHILLLNSKSYSANFEHLPNGVYSYSVTCTSGPVGNGKLILIK